MQPTRKRGGRVLLEDGEASRRWHVLRSFGAVPLPCEAAPSHRLGRLPGSGTLVAAYLPHERVTVGTLLELLLLRDGLAGLFDRVAVLAWHFAASIHDDVRGLNVPEVFMLHVVTTPLPAAAPVRFEALRCLRLGPVVRRCPWGGAREQLSVTLADYAAPSAGGDGETAPTSGMALLRWWAVDPAHDGQCWRPAWESLAVEPPALPSSVLLDLPLWPGPRTVCVRSRDRYGLESQVLVRVAMVG